MMIAAFVAAVLAACQPTAEAHKQLEQQFNEQRISASLNVKGNILEVWSSPTGSWTALITKPDGMSCVLDYGTGVATFPMPKPGRPA